MVRRKVLGKRGRKWRAVEENGFMQIRAHVNIPLLESCDRKHQSFHIVPFSATLQLFRSISIGEAMDLLFEPSHRRKR
jgi:hypothetical protein